MTDFMKRLGKLPVLVLVLTLAAIAVVTVLETRADASRQAQLRVGALNLAVTDLDSAPFTADPRAGGAGAPARARAQIVADERVLWAGLAKGSGVGASPASLAAAAAELTSVQATVGQIYPIFARSGGLGGDLRIPGLQMRLTVHTGRLAAVLKAIGRVHAAQARRARLEAAVGTALAMLALVAVFLTFYVRSRRAQTAAERLVRENQQLLEASRVEATTDALTGLRNRRALTDELPGAISAAETVPEPELLLAMFDLNGFKQYNDTFGHGAGDALLSRLGARLALAVDGGGSAYRMGGDEFCVMAHCTPQAGEGILAAAAAALSDRGDGWSIDCSYGAVWIPSEATTAGDALQTADLRMYANKTMRSSASRQLTDVLQAVLSEHDKAIDAHVGHVAALAVLVARGLDLPDHEVQRIGLAAKLHDIGTTPIPASILNKPGPLDEHEWTFVHGHTIVGERIVLAAPALAHTAPLVRSEHERIDGSGYPDGLRGDQIPIGSRIIAVCDAYDAMTSSRAYRDAMPHDVAIEELTRCAGSQFDPDVVQAFCCVAPLPLPLAAGPARR